MIKSTVDPDCTGQFSALFLDYIHQKPEVSPFFNQYPTIGNFKKLMDGKKFKDSHRKVLLERLNFQYQGIKVSEVSGRQIQSLADSNTFTVTTGHQLNLFSGPLYFLYKIISTINLTTELKKKYPASNFVPVYWMATEDHDFEEINHFHFKGKKISWNKETSGPVGRLSTNGLDEVFEVFEKELGIGNNAEYLKIRKLYSFFIYIK